MTDVSKKNLDVFLKWDSITPPHGGLSSNLPGVLLFSWSSMGYKTGCPP